MSRVRRRISVAFALFMAVTMILAGCASQSKNGSTAPNSNGSDQGQKSGTEPPKQKVKIRLGYGQTVWGAPLMLALDQKVWDKYGLEIETVSLGSGKEVRDAMIAGSVDIGSVGSTPLIVGAAKADVVTVGAVAYAGDTLAIVVRKDSGIKTLADLKGKKIATQFGSSTDFALRKGALPANGMSENDIQPVNIKFQDMVAALASKSVDAFAGVEPYIALADEQGIGVSILKLGAYDMTPLFLGVQGKFLREQPEAVNAFLKGYMEVVDQFKHNPDKVADTLVKSFEQAGWKLSKKVIADSLAGMQVTVDYRPGLREYMEGQVKDLIADGSITKGPDWDKVLLTEPLKKATAK